MRLHTMQSVYLSCSLESSLGQAYEVKAVTPSMNPGYEAACPNAFSPHYRMTQFL